jgi:hypothetical protein
MGGMEMSILMSLRWWWRRLEGQGGNSVTAFIHHQMRKQPKITSAGSMCVIESLNLLRNNVSCMVSSVRKEMILLFQIGSAIYSFAALNAFGATNREGIASSTLWRAA